MIGRITGMIAEKLPPEVLIEAAGVGYEIQMPMTSFYQLPEVGQQASVYTHFVVREDAQLLFGFADKKERTLFRELIKINGVGPKLGLTILSGMSASQFVQCVSLEDVSTLVKIPGVGKKTAERLLIEMKDKLDKLPEFGQSGAVSNIEQSAPGDTLVGVNAAKEEALSALLALGYKAPQANKVINAVYQEGMGSEALIREALRSMA